MADAFLASLHDRIADLETRRVRANGAERLTINGQIGLIQAIIHDYQMIKNEAADAAP